MKLKRHLSRLSHTPITWLQALEAAAVLILLFGPLGAVAVFPDSQLVKMLFGSGVRIILFYSIVIGVAVWIDWPSIKRWAKGSGEETEK